MTANEIKFKADANTYLSLCIQAENEKDAIHKMLSDEIQALKVHNMLLMLENEQLKYKINSAS